jgi:hypothetical protein
MLSLPPSVRILPARESVAPLWELVPAGSLRRPAKVPTAER